MKKFIASLALATLTFSAAAQTLKSPFSYNYIQAGYLNGSLNIDGTKFDTSGFGVGASASVSDNVYLLGSYNTGSAKVSTLTIDQRSFAFGVGGRMPIGKQTDLVGDVSYVNSKASVPSVAVTVTGYGFGAGIRHAIDEKIELNGNVGLSILGSDRVQTTSLSLGLRYKLAEKISVGGSYNMTNNDDGSGRGFLGSLRFDF